MECGETWRADQASPSGRTFSFLPYVPSLWLLAWPALPCSAHARPVWPPIRKPWLCVWCGSAVKAQGGRKRSGLPQFWLLLSLFLGEEGRSSSTSLLVQIKPPASAVMPFAVLCKRRIAHKQPHNAKVSTHKAFLLHLASFFGGDALRWRGFKALFLPCRHFTAPAHHTETNENEDKMKTPWQHLYTAMVHRRLGLQRRTTRRSAWQPHTATHTPHTHTRI